METIRIVTDRPEYREAFARLNLAWVERYFVIEAHDREMLMEPEKYILADGGQIFLAVTGSEEVVGTAALIACPDGSFELAKMSVAETFQGRGIGRRLGEAVIDWARERGVSRLWLESNRRLTPALRLYESLGFVEVPLVPSPYARADIRMELNLCGTVAIKDQVSCDASKSEG